MIKITRILLAIFFIALLAAGMTLSLSQSPIYANPYENPHLVETITTDDGKKIDKIMVPGRPPAIKAEAVTIPEPNIAMGINNLSNVPAFDWSYGCSATAAAMLFGYYDNDGYHTNMYAGPENGGVCPMDNSGWGSGECPLSATHMGYDGLAVRGHVDDYWISYGSTAPDPWIGNWPEHTHADCTGDFMGTNQSTFGNKDGSTLFWFFTNGSAFGEAGVIVYLDPDTERDGGHGLQLFTESRGYNISNWYNQYIDAYGATYGFTFAQYVAEIDAGRPVLIHVTGHTMLGFGYDDSTNTVYLHDTWDYSNHTMTWGGTYPYGIQELQHYGVTVLQLETVWESYKGDYGDSGGTVDDYFEEYSSEHDVYMYGNGFDPGTYKVIYWDGAGDEAAAEFAAASGGTIRSSHTFEPGEGVEGDWHVTVYNQSANPPDYNPVRDAGIIVADDTSYTGDYAFHLEATAIPEFPTAIIAIAVLAICAGIYLWLRRKAAPVSV